MVYLCHFWKLFNLMFLSQSWDKWLIDMINNCMQSWACSSPRFSVYALFLSIAYVLCMPDFFGIELYRPNIVVDIYSWRTLYATDLRSLVSVWSVCGWVTRVQGRRGILHATRGQSCRCHPCRKYRTLWRSRRTRSVSLGPSQANLGASYNAIQTHSHRAFIAAFNH